MTSNCTSAWSMAASWAMISPGEDSPTTFCKSGVWSRMASRITRQHADDEISDTLARLPTPGLIAQLIDLAAPLTS
jgi:hypothetical protein